MVCQFILCIEQSLTFALRSKIKHDKAVKDGRMAKHRVLLAQDIVLAVKCTYF